MKAKCEACNGEGYFENISECCNAIRNPDMGLCHECHDHCEPQKCYDCDGTGFVTVELIDTEL